MARVFVGIPTRNRPGYVEEAVRSVLGQSFQDFRLLVSDNASESAASQSVERFVREQADSRAAYFRQETNVKEYGQGRFLFQQCREEYFVILHDDDAMARDLLEFAVDVLAKDPALAFVSTGQRLIDENGRAQEELTRWYSAQQGRDRFPEGRLDDLLDPLLRFGLFSISGSVFRTAALRDSALVDPDLGGSYPFEFNVFLRVAERGWPAFYTPRPLLAYRWHHDSMRAAEKPSFHKEMTANLITLVERRRFSGPAERRRRRLLSFNHRNYAIVSYLDGARLQSYRHLARAVRLNPWSPKIWAYVFLRAFLPFLIGPLFGSRVVLAPSR